MTGVLIKKGGFGYKHVDAGRMPWEHESRDQAVMCL